MQEKIKYKIYAIPTTHTMSFLSFVFFFFFFFFEQRTQPGVPQTKVYNMTCRMYFSKDNRQQQYLLLFFDFWGKNLPQLKKKNQDTCRFCDKKKFFLKKKKKKKSIVCVGPPKTTKASAEHPCA